ncbi:MAG: glycine zipper 2TM domain-containing protein [Verrucomicrobia bacterium]|nr:glycine zipper 2TM domain-containing protein [Verrucomicrobiota bacterium]
MKFSGRHAWPGAARAWGDYPPAKDPNQTARGAVAGAVAGAVLGGIIGNNSEHGNTEKGAAIGAVAGGIAGAAIGHRTDQTGSGRLWLERCRLHRAVRPSDASFGAAGKSTRAARGQCRLDSGPL